MQRTLSVGRPGDSFEQEADRVADAVMATSRLGAIGGGARAQVQRACAACQEEREVDIGGLRGGGRPLSAGERGFFEPRFGWSFGSVRIHDDNRADHLARSISADAFTFGTDIAFRRGTYAPASASSQRLLAHELTHVVQQGGGAPAFGSRIGGRDEEPFESAVPRIGAASPRVQRTATWAAGTERSNWDAADRAINGGGVLGFTPPVLNGVVVMSGAATAAQLVAPSTGGRSVVGGTAESWFGTNGTNTASYELDVFDGGPHSVVTTKATAAATMRAFAGGAPAACTGADPTTFAINGRPDNATYQAGVVTHERHHASDHQAGFTTVIGAWDTAIDRHIRLGTRFPGATAADSDAAMWAAVGGTPTQIGTAQFAEWIRLNTAFHGTPAGTTLPGTSPTADATCTTCSMDHRYP